jgi:hypothetical protein
MTATQSPEPDYRDYLVANSTPLDEFASDFAALGGKFNAHDCAVQYLDANGTQMSERCFDELIPPLERQMRYYA